MIKTGFTSMLAQYIKVSIAQSWLPLRHKYIGTIIMACNFKIVLRADATTQILVPCEIYIACVTY